jgi:histidyl-tRNA synthetase
MKACSIEDDFVLDTSITRGLDYYTGIVYETLLLDMPQIGSICSGGRYNNLAGLYTKENLPGVGSCIGLDRLIAGLSQLGLAEGRGSYIDAEIFNQNANLAVTYVKAAAALRERGVAVEVFPDAAKMNKQYAVTDKKGIKWGIFVGEDGSLTLKNLETREQFEGISADEAANKIRG